nr:PIN domain-containing protein [Kineococcus vitellinus]
MSAGPVGEGYVLDTGVVIDLMRSPAGTRFSHDVGSATYLSIVSVSELMLGVQTASGLERKRREVDLARVRRRWPVPIPYDEEVLEAYDYVLAALLDAGKQPRKVLADALIAASAFSIGVPVLTGNVADFRGLEELVGVEAFEVVSVSDAP